jgi:hypothetical protein
MKAYYIPENRKLLKENKRLKNALNDLVNTKQLKDTKGKTMRIYNLKRNILELLQYKNK